MGENGEKKRDNSEEIGFLILRTNPEGRSSALLTALPPFSLSSPKMLLLLDRSRSIALAIKFKYHSLIRESFS